MEVFKKISRNKELIIIAFVIVLMAITFETAQQLYYIRHFNLAEGVTFVELFKNQTYTWLIWVALSFFLINHAKIISRKKPTIVDIVKHVLIVLLVVFANILIISIIQALLSNITFSTKLFFEEFFSFFIFQKAPIYMLCYILISIIFYFYYVNNQLSVEVQELKKIEEINIDLYKKLRTTLEDKSQVLNIKVGNKRKIVPVDDIYWIEADDYCAKVHLVNNLSYSMRVSLNSLENTLDDKFIRVHRKSIVNMSMIKEFNVSQKPSLILKDNTIIPVSKSKIKKVKVFLA